MQVTAHAHVGQVFASEVQEEGSIDTVVDEGRAILRKSLPEPRNEIADLVGTPRAHAISRCHALAGRFVTLRRRSVSQ